MRIRAAALIALLALAFSFALADEPTVSTREQLVEYLLSCAENGDAHVSFYYTKALDAYIEDENWMTSAVDEGGMMDARWQYSPARRKVEFTYIEYYADIAPKARTLEELYAIIAQNAAARKTEFTVSYGGALDLYNDEAALDRAMYANGAKDFTWEIRPDSARARIAEITYYENFLCAQTEAEALAFLRACANALKGEFALYGSNAAYAALARDDFALLDSIEGNLGILDRDLYYDDEYNTVSYENVRYYPGLRAAKAYASGETGALSSAERKLLDKALSIVSAARAQSETPLALEKALNDALCAQTTYFTGETDAVMPYDTAAGALLNGKADCDGYADAFYLLASLAGFDTRFQQGVSRDEPDISHMWNLISLYGQWYMIDVTWNDNDDEDAPELPCVYWWFNLDAARAAQTHEWDARACDVALAPAQDARVSFYLCGDPSAKVFQSARDAAEWAYRSGARGQSVLHLLIEGQGDCEEAFNAALDENVISGDWYYFTQSAGDDLHITLLWENCQ